MNITTHADMYSGKLFKMLWYSNIYFSVDKDSDLENACDEFE
jgi:hypothetical protein